MSAAGSIVRRGTAIALISAGQYVAGALWPAVFQLGIDTIGWRHTMLAYAVFVVVVILPLAAIFLRAPAGRRPRLAACTPDRGPASRCSGLPPNLVLAALAFATFCCCVTMSMPMAHMVAFCSDIGIAPTQGAAMLSVLLGSAFFARQFWGWLADRVGGLRTILWASAAQAAAMAGFLVTQDEIGLFTISAVFGFGFGGLIPGYVLAVRELFPASEASWRIPTMLFPGSLGHGGGRLAGRRDVRPVRILCAGLRGRRAVQPAEPGGDRLLWCCGTGRRGCFPRPPDQLTTTISSTPATTSTSPATSPGFSVSFR